jgi:hypothetical protein
MRLRAIIYSLLISNLIVNAKEVKIENAQKIASSFFQSKSTFKQKSQATSQTILSGKAIVKSGTTSYFAFNRGKNAGFVLIAGDDRVSPILGYADQGSFDTSLMAPQTKAWFSLYEKSISELSSSNAKASSQVESEWFQLQEGTTNDVLPVVAPLLKTNWAQTQYYNDSCPYDTASNCHVYAGCVATAMAQIMSYWQYPTTGSGSHSYVASSAPQYGTLTANFGTTTYDWTNLPATLNTTNNAIATLIFHCGVAVEMDYSSTGSSALVRGSYPYTAEKAFVNYFRYASSIQSKSKGSTSESEWLQLLKTELSNGRPVLYNAQDLNAGGHAFVIDGYDSNDFFHVNWGWNGIANGYFRISNLNPLSYTFDKGQSAVFNIVPVSDSINLAETFKLQSDTAEICSPFSFTAKVKNTGNTLFNGELCVKVLNADSIPLASSTITSLSLEAGQNSCKLIFDSIVLSLPGQYSAKLYYRKSGGQWLPLPDKDFQNNTVFTAIKKDSISLNSNFTIERNSVICGEPLSVNVLVTNASNTVFYQPFRLAFYSLDGTLKETLNADHLTAIQSDSIASYTFSTTALSTIQGDYKMVAEYFGDEKWTPAGGTIYLNGQDIHIFPPINDDVYEYNNTLANASSIALTSSFVEATTKATDDDYYKIIIGGEKKYLYTISVQMSKVKSVSTDGANVLFSWTKDSLSWPQSVPTELANNITVKTSDTLYLHISPASNNEAGTYLFSWTIINQSVIEDDTPTQPISKTIYPNPADASITMNQPLGQVVTSWTIVNQSGAVQKMGTTESNIIDISNLDNGVYIFSAQTTEGAFRQKFIKK